MIKSSSFLINFDIFDRFWYFNLYFNQKWITKSIKYGLKSIKNGLKSIKNGSSYQKLVNFNRSKMFTEIGMESYLNWLFRSICNQILKLFVFLATLWLPIDSVKTVYSKQKIAIWKLFVRSWVFEDPIKTLH